MQQLTQETMTQQDKQAQRHMLGLAGEFLVASMLGIIGGAALLIAVPFSLQWSQNNVPLSLRGAEANATNVAGVSRRVHRRAYRRAVYGTAAAFGLSRCRLNVAADRYRPEYISPPAGGSYYLPPFSFASSYDYC